MSTAVCRSFPSVASLANASLPELNSQPSLPPQPRAANAAPDAPVAFSDAFLEHRLAQHRVWQDDEAARLAEGIVEEVLAHEQVLRHELNRMQVVLPARRV